MPISDGKKEFFNYVKRPADAPSDGDLIGWDSATSNFVWYPAGTSFTLADAFKLFHAYNHAGGQSITTTAASLTFDTETKKDSIYSHTAGNAGITVSTAGLYEVKADVAIANSSGSTASYVTAWLAIGTTEIEGTRAVINATSGRGSATITAMVELAASDVLNVRAQLNTGSNTIATVADGCRVSLNRVAA